MNIMLKSLVAGLQFLTILPCGSLQPLHIRRVLPLFPICGVIIGLVLALTDHLAGCLWDRQVVAVMDLVLL
ncbi:MAG: adenosylcobinamide-GDP ribazoletransferase, partial [Desulfatitalea sp.]|nr:adenosylcobinamide-GDP ribazoletransferase [Desulfatitalea sp.]NNK01083.1 adenosylcobinamide-GDP ribazoletransferase [Desulfatitalea sp.]